MKSQMFLDYQSKLKSRQVSNAAHRDSIPREGSRQLRILNMLKEKEMTDDEMEIESNISHQSLSASRRALVKKHLVEPTGELRRTRTGSMAQVWKAITSDL